MENRNKLKEAAIKLIVSKGFQATSTASVSKQANLATGTLFNYFKSKDELLATIYLEALAEKGQAVLDKLEAANTADNEENMQLIWDGLIKWGHANKNASKYLSFYGASPFAAKLKSVDNPMNDVSAKALKAIGEESGLGISNELLFQLFLAQADAVVEHAHAKKVNKADLEELSFEAFQVFWDAMR